MSRFIDLTGEKFGRLVVIKRIGKDKSGNIIWLCRCDCKTEKIIRGASLKNKTTRSCGCLNKEKIIERQTKHGHWTSGKASKSYNAWSHIKQRCTNISDPSYHRYGGRHISICKRWLKFENFLDDMGEPPTRDHSIDRIDNNGNYCKDNCRWATSEQQARNRRNNKLITCNGKTQLLIEWAKETRISHTVILWRIKRGWSIDRAITTPVKKYKKRSK